LARSGKWITSERPSYCGLYIEGSNNLPRLVLSSIRWKSAASGRADITLKDRWGATTTRQIANSRFSLSRPKHTSYIPSSGKAGRVYSRIRVAGKVYTLQGW